MGDEQRTKRREQYRNASIDGPAFKSLMEAGLTWLRTNQQLVNSLNVFPVPDGDTGTNMVLTMQAAVDEIEENPENNVGAIAHDLAHGALMGARGNSGVILSQIWRGFARAIDRQEKLDAPSLSRAFAEARDTAYKGVVRPVEGTILTVAKDVASAAQTTSDETEDPVKILEAIVEAADASVKKTPELLPVLKEAGVVDSGGKGLYFILEGMVRYIYNQPLDRAVTTVQPLAAMNLEETLESIEPGQDYEVVVDFRPDQPLNLEQFYGDLEEMGTSIQVGEGDGIYRMHIHVPTEKRYEPIDYTMSLGTITKVAIENLLAQMEEIDQSARGGKLTLAPVEPGQIAVVAVAPGTGIARVFASLGAAAVVEGGQTMNPSTQEILSAFENLPTDKIVILPNNKNIVMAAKSAAEITVKRVGVVPSKSVPQGLAAMLRLIPDGEFDDIVEEMSAAIEEVVTAEVTTATRNVEIDEVFCQQGQSIGLLDGKLVVATNSLPEAVLGILEKAQAEDYELITFFYGSDVAKNEVNRIVDKVRSEYPDQEIEVQVGGQPHYQFIISIE